MPVATSSLIQVPWVQAMLPPGKRVGVITVSGSSLTPRHLARRRRARRHPFVGTEDGVEFFRVLILGEKQDMDVALASRDILDAGRRLMTRHPDVGAIVLECTNMPPYAHMLQEALGVPVFRYLFVDHLAACGHTTARFRRDKPRIGLRPPHQPELISQGILFSVRSYPRSVS